MIWKTTFRSDLLLQLTQGVRFSLTNVKGVRAKGKSDNGPLLNLYKMTLQEILYGSFMPPEHAKTRRNTLGISGGARYQEPTKRTYRNSDGLGKTELRVYEELKQHTKPISSIKLAELVGISRENCSVILASLHKRGYTRRHKVEEGSVRFYVYLSKEAS